MGVLGKPRLKVTYIVSAIQEHDFKVFVGWTKGFEVASKIRAPQSQILLPSLAASPAFYGYRGGRCGYRQGEAISVKSKLRLPANVSRPESLIEKNHFGIVSPKLLNLDIVREPLARAIGYRLMTDIAPYRHCPSWGT
jgi:hypothetical protein